MGLEESVCCKQILISGSLKVAERRKQNFRSQLCQSPHGLQHGRSKRAKGLLCSKSRICTLSKMATVPAVLDSVPCQVTFARSSSSAGRAAPHEERKKEAPWKLAGRR